MKSLCRPVTAQFVKLTHAVMSTFLTSTANSHLTAPASELVTLAIAYAALRNLMLVLHAPLRNLSVVALKAFLSRTVIRTIRSGYSGGTWLIHKCGRTDGPVPLCIPTGIMLSSTVVGGGSIILGIISDEDVGVALTCEGCITSCTGGGCVTGCTGGVH